MRVIRGLLGHSAVLAAAFTLIFGGALPAYAQSATLQKTAVPIDGNGDGFFAVGETVQYTLVLTNTGATDLTNVLIQDSSNGCIRLDEGSLVIAPASAGTSNSSGGYIQVNLTSPLAPGATVTLTFVGTSTAAGYCCNVATWNSSEVALGNSDRDPSDTIPDQATCHTTADVTGPDTDALIDKQVLSAGCLAPGSVVQFRIRVQNSGRRPLRNVQVQDVLDPGFTNVVVGGGLTYDPATNRVSMDGGTWGVGQDELHTYSATLPCTGSGTLSNTAQLTFEDQRGDTFRRSDTETVTWGTPNLSTSTKTWHDDPFDADFAVSPGETVSFVITIYNTGECEALDVAVSDPLDPRLVATAPTLVVGEGGIADSAARTIDWNSTTTPQLAAIPPGGVVSLTFTTQIEPGTSGGEFIPNTVTLTVLGNQQTCPALPPQTYSLSLLNGDVASAPTVVSDLLLRNGFVSCRRDAFPTIHGLYPGSNPVPVLIARPPPQECSSPSAINQNHPATDAILNPTSPYKFPGDGAPVVDTCPQIAVGSGRVLVFYELYNDCTPTLRVMKDPSNRWDIIVTW